MTLNLASLLKNVIIIFLFKLSVHQNPSFGWNSSTNSLKLILASPLLSTFYNIPYSSLSVAKNPLLAKNSLKSSSVRFASPFLSMYVKAYFKLKYGLDLKPTLKTSEALSHLKREAQRFLISARVSWLKNWEGGTPLLM